MSYLQFELNVSFSCAYKLILQVLLHLNNTTNPMQHKKATYSILKGTWLYFSESKDKEVSIHLSNTGMQRIYINGELQSEKRSLKMKSEQSFSLEDKTYSFKTFPSNPQLTAFDCELRINETLVRVYKMKYNFDWKKYLVLFGGIFLITLVVILRKYSDTVLYTANGIYLLVVLGFFANRLMVIEEIDNDVRNIL